MDWGELILLEIIAVSVLVGLIIAYRVSVSKEKEKKAKHVSLADVEKYQEQLQQYLQQFEEYSWIQQKPCVHVWGLDKKIFGEGFSNIYCYEIFSPDLYRLMPLLPKESASNSLWMNVGVHNNKLYFFPTKDCFYVGPGSWDNKFLLDSTPKNIYPYTIDLEDIDYYAERGERQVYTTMSGGGDAAGALVGGLIGGTVGALVGGTSPIKTTVHDDDTRHVVLYYKKDGENQVLHFYLSAFDSFKRVIPEFDIAVKANKKER